jgi:hypothetical protein
MDASDGDGIGERGRKPEAEEGFRDFAGAIDDIKLSLRKEAFGVEIDLRHGGRHRGQVGRFGEFPPF